MVTAALMLNACGTVQSTEPTTAVTAAAESTEPAAQADASGAAVQETEADASGTSTNPQAVSEEDTWNLTEYFADEAAFDAEAAAVTEELLKVKEMVGQVSDPQTLLEFLQYDDGVSQRIGHMSCYAQQKLDLDASDSTALKQKNTAYTLSQDYSLSMTTLNNRLVGLGDSFWSEVFADANLEPYTRQLTDIKDSAAHLLSDEKEELLMPMYQAQSNINDAAQTLLNVDMEFKTIKDPQGQEVQADYNNYISAMENPDRDYRALYYETFVGRLAAYRNTLAQNLNAYTTMSEQSAKLHNYDSVIDSAMDDAELSEEIYNALIDGARSNMDVRERENELRKKVLGYDTLNPYDGRVPLGDAKAPSYTYEEAKNIIKEGLAPLGEDYVAVLDQAFDNRWIDVYPSDNKITGAYSGMAVDLHPWVLTNFTEDYNSVSTLAHELGHAVHQYESYVTQESVYNQNPTSLVSEVASTANEQILSRYMIEHAKDDGEKLYYVQQELDMLKNTFFGQIMFADFEKQFHDVVAAGGVLTADQLDEMYLETSKLYSPGVEIPEYSASYWGEVPHFYYNYYVYSYAMDVAISCQVASAISAGDETMLKNYKEFLKAGDSASAPELFARLGVDVTKPDYIKPLMERYGELLNMEEELLK